MLSKNGQWHWDSFQCQVVVTFTVREQVRFDLFPARLCRTTMSQLADRSRAPMRRSERVASDCRPSFRTCTESFCAARSVRRVSRQSVLWSRVNPGGCADVCSM